ncbi:Uncharacterised protein [Mycobacterium tuberculosis]|uniref:Uncharacterized protein n=1 Tax=Mycobacterium tuberculosis TaxID=1773 RepID=A0A654TES6_MYCTX|nr:Uncharacterised protein [Mycobacterium tuberculosis]CFE72049.1 Uncharacterised protein [Mycobacterium tuberculosis]CKR31014.1 Uncharacterised protein [Mycobacterium tuberculosis]CKR58899.1 Uncharacterised protein [Mycobacterium tuberculosis]COW16941.1 Uncharacterised protein [Mycobacterium tuberculosis]
MLGRLRDHACADQVRGRPATHRHGDRMQPRRRRLPAGHVEPLCAGCHRRPGVPDRIRRLQHRIQCSASPATGTHLPRAGGRSPRQPQRCRDQGQLQRSSHRDDRHLAHTDARASDRRLDERISALCGSQRVDFQGPRRGYPHQHRRPGTAELPCRIHRTRIRLHQCAITFAASTGGFSG